MPEIIPFKGLRFDPRAAGDMADILCPPYDIISPAMQEELYRRSPWNAVRLELPREPDPYGAAAERLLGWLQDGVLLQDAASALYPYYQSYTGPDGTAYTRKGFFCALRLSEFSERKVLPHERTLSGPKKDRLSLFTTTRTNISSIFGLYADRERQADRVIEQAVASRDPLVDAVFDGVRNRLWSVDDPDVVERVQQVLLERQAFIADGHHRYETGLAYRKLRAADNPSHTGSEPYNFILAYLANIHDEGLIIFPLHRMVHHLRQFDPEKLMAQLEEYFFIQPFDGRGQLNDWLRNEPAGHVYGLVTQQGVYGLRLRVAPEAVCRESVSLPLCQLGVVVLHELVLKRLLGMSDEAVSSQANLVYEESDHRVFDAVEGGEVQAGFLVQPTTVQQVLDISGSGEVMPQKSTYFYPKLMTGLVMHRL